LRSGETGIVRIQVKEAVCLEKFEKMEGLGRFTLRDEGKTIGYG
jgi:peptide chain release factor subunit 3